MIKPENDSSGQKENPQNDDPVQPWRDEMLRRQDINSRRTAEFTAMHRSTIDYGLAAIRGGLLLNGGGAVAILSFMAASKQLRSIGLLEGLVLFVAGAMFAAVTASISYISQGYYIEEGNDKWSDELVYSEERGESAKLNRKKADFFRVSGCIAIGAAYFLFVLGCISTYYALKSISNL